jgi:uncharacterized membrane protein
MSDSSSDNDAESRTESKPGWKRLLTGRLPFEQETSAFVLVSVLDIIMTYLLLRTGRFIESNPVADYFIAHWGSRGMIYFKLGMTAFVCVLAQIVAQKKPSYAEFILKIGTLIVGCVVIYSLVLFIRMR